MLRRGAKAQPPRHRRAAPQHVDLVEFGAPLEGCADVATIKRSSLTVGSTHRGPSIALGVSPPAAPLAVPGENDEERRDGLEPECGACHFPTQDALHGANSLVFLRLRKSAQESKKKEEKWRQSSHLAPFACDQEVTRHVSQILAKKTLYSAKR